MSRMSAGEQHAAFQTLLEFRACTGALQGLRAEPKFISQNVEAFCSQLEAPRRLPAY